ncbi:hypothetical protein TRIUR3_07630 [Triticum urartu]|uniref:Uncharacterized protein n=1 Tax=Triticum urartu TaxID=4572 RepID=M7ZIR8_TRIUA|nr:hypothetical protein TRIUR3_07630 [Triticum urartu]
MASGHDGGTLEALWAPIDNMAGCGGRSDAARLWPSRGGRGAAGDDGVVGRAEAGRLAVAATMDVAADYSS